MTKYRHLRLIVTPGQPVAYEEQLAGHMAELARRCQMIEQYLHATGFKPAAEAVAAVGVAASAVAWAVGDSPERVAS